MPLPPFLICAHIGQEDGRKGIFQLSPRLHAELSKERSESIYPSQDLPDERDRVQVGEEEGRTRGQQVVDHGDNDPG